MPAALIMPLLGSLRERVGAKAIATVGPGLFGVACLISAMATDPQLFIAMRVLQGLGAGVIPAAAGGYLGGQLGEKYTPMGKGLVALALVTGSSAGIPFSGFITWYVSWRVLYAVLGLAALAAVAVIARLMPATPGNPQAEIDWLGYGLMAGGFGLLAVSLVVGNQREWFSSPTYVVMLWSALLLIGLFAWRVVAVPKLINLRIFQDINYCISVVNLSSVMFFLFMVFAIVPRFLMVVLDNTIENYSWAFMPFVGTAMPPAVMVTPGVSPHLIAATDSSQEEALRDGDPAVCLHGPVDGQHQRPAGQHHLTLQLMAVGVVLRADQLPGDSDVVLHHGGRADDQRQLGAVLLHQHLQGALRRRECRHPHRHKPGQLGALPRADQRRQPSARSLSKTPERPPVGISGDAWSQGSLELMNKAISQQVEVVSFINIATMVGLALLVLCALPLLHRSPVQTLSPQPAATPGNQPP